MDERVEREKELARLGRTISIVIAGTMLFWMGAQWIGREAGLPEEYVFLFDLFALAGFLWAIFVTFQLWRKRRDLDKE